MSALLEVDPRRAGVEALRAATLDILTTHDPLGLYYHGGLQALADTAASEEEFVEAARLAYRVEAARRAMVGPWHRFQYLHPGEYLLVEGDRLLSASTSKGYIEAVAQALGDDVTWLILGPDDDLDQRAVDVMSRLALEG